MTVVAAYADNGTVWMAADTYASAGGGTVAEVQKVLRIPVGDSEALLGIAGSAPLIQLVAFDFDAPALRDGGDLDEWAYRVAVELTRVCRKAGHPVVNDNNDQFIGGGFLLRFAGSLWRVGTNEATPLGGYYAIGSGGAEALGALYAFHLTGKLQLNPDRWVQAAVDAACHWDRDCRAPVTFHVLDPSGPALAVA